MALVPEVVARLVCPRRLLPDSAWLACVVPAFLPGVDRGLGKEVVPGGELKPAALMKTRSRP